MCSSRTKFVAMSFVLACGVLLSGCHISFSSMDGYSFDYSGVKAERTESDAIGTGVTEIDIENKFGTVIVKETAGAAKWEWTAECWSDDQTKAEAFTKAVKMETSSIGKSQTFKVVLPEPSGDFNGLKSLLTIHVPVATKVSVSNSFGPVRITGISEHSKIKNRHGNVELSKLKGSTEVECSHGDVEINEVDGAVAVTGRHSEVRASNVNGDVNVKTTHDSISLDRINGAATVECSHGSVIANIDGDLTCELSHSDLTGSCMGTSISLEGTHSEFKISATNPALKSVEIETTHDDVSLVLDSSLQANLDVKVSHGDVNNDFESVNSNGAAQIRVVVSHGNVNIRKASAN